MSLSLREWRDLHEIDRTVRRSDPRLAALLAIFSRLAASDIMPGHKRLPARVVRLWAITMLAGTAAARVITQTAAAAAGVLGRACWRPVSAVALLPARFQARRAWSRDGRAATGWQPNHPDPFHH